MKYVVFKQGPLLIPILFPDCLSHVDVKVTDGEPVSAGFVDIWGGIPEVSVQVSTSLNLGPNIRRDEDLIGAQLNELGTMSFLASQFE